MKQFFTSPKFKHIVTWTGLVVLLLVAFQAGMFVGFHKAKMALHFDANYEHAYGEHFKSGPFGIPDNDFPEAHGAIGRILSINLPTMVVEDRNREKVIFIATDTLIRKDHGKIDAATLQPNDFVVVIGTPNEKSEIEAKFIRTLPPPPDFMVSTSSDSSEKSTSSIIK